MRRSNVLIYPIPLVSVKTEDPPLQRKKRVEQFPASPVKQSASPVKQPIIEQDDYILLSDQQKFAPSVKYMLKKVNIARRKVV